MTPQFAYKFNKRLRQVCVCAVIYYVNCFNSKKRQQSQVMIIID